MPFFFLCVFFVLFLLRAKRLLRLAAPVPPSPGCLKILRLAENHSRPISRDALVAASPKWGMRRACGSAQFRMVEGQPMTVLLSSRVGTQNVVPFEAKHG